MTYITMSKKELDRYQIISRLLRKEINTVKASELLDLGLRQIKRLKKAVKLLGPKPLVHKSRGKQGNHRLPDSEHKQIIHLLKDKYADFGPTLASEKLRSEEHTSELQSQF